MRSHTLAAVGELAQLVGSARGPAGKVVLVQAAPASQQAPTLCCTTHGSRLLRLARYVAACGSCGVTAICDVFVPCRASSLGRTPATRLLCDVAEQHARTHADGCLLLMTFASRYHATPLRTTPFLVLQPRSKRTR